MKIHSLWIGVSLLSLFTISALSGCGESAGPDPKVETKRVEDLTQIRKFYDQVGGTYDQLSVADKAEFVKLCGGDEGKAKQTWDAMKFGPAGPPKG